MLMIACIYLSM